MDKFLVHDIVNLASSQNITEQKSMLSIFTFW